MEDSGSAWDTVRVLFDEFCSQTSDRAQRRAKEVTLCASIDQTDNQQSSHKRNRDDEELGVRLSTDRFVGSARLRTLRALLLRIDQRGFARSQHQLQFHAAFEQACSRVVYKEEFPVHFASIMRENNWESVSGEVLISTPRRFGKTFSVAIFCAALALSCKQEIVIFSPGRRASRAILVRVQEFVITLGFESNILEYNQEQLRVKTLNGYTSTVRSFPSKKQVCAAPARTPRPHRRRPRREEGTQYNHRNRGRSTGTPPHTRRPLSDMVRAYAKRSNRLPRAYAADGEKEQHNQAYHRRHKRRRKCPRQ